MELRQEAPNLLYFTTTQITTHFCHIMSLSGKKTAQQHKTIETTDIMLQMVASGRGITALPRWLVEDSQKRFGLKAVPIGPGGIWKEISAGIRDQDSTTGRYKVPFRNERNGTTYPYCRSYTTVSGEVSTGINYSCHLVKI